MDHLATKTTPNAVRLGLEHLPAGANATYDETMNRIKGQIEDDWELAKNVLCWITYARRPLFVEELQHALAVSPGMTKMDIYDQVDVSILTSVCAGLVIVEKQGNKVRLVRKQSSP